MKKIIGLFVMALGLSVVLVSCAKQDVEDALFQSVASVELTEKSSIVSSDVLDNARKAGAYRIYIGHPVPGSNGSLCYSSGGNCLPDIIVEVPAPEQQYSVGNLNDGMNSDQIQNVLSNNSTFFAEQLGEDILLKMMNGDFNVFVNGDAQADMGVYLIVKTQSGELVKVLPIFVD